MIRSPQSLDEIGFLTHLLIYRSPARLLLITVATIGLMEFAVMGVLNLLPPLPGWVDNAVDAGLMIVVVFPMLYLFVFRPFILHVDASKRIEQTLREVEKSLRLLMDTSIDAIVRVDEAGRIIGWNEQAQIVFGWSTREALQQTVADLIFPVRNREEFCLYLKTFLETGNASHLNTRFEIEALNRLGHELPIEMAISPVKTAQGHIFSVFIRDITERKRTEMNLLLAAKVFENSGEGIAITDQDNQIITVNPAFTAITGYSLGDAVGKTPSVLKSGRHDDAFYTSMWETLRDSGRWQGEVWNRRKNGEIYPEWLSITCVRNEKGDVVNHFATFADITTRKAATDRIEHMAHYDQLTGLPNRALLKDRLEQALARARRNHSKVAILFLDLDGFKAVNDTWGHECGDYLLIEVGKRLRATVREEDTVSRIGGDEFIILLDDDCSHDAAETVASKVIEALAKPVDHAGHELRIGTSVGIAIFPNTGHDCLTLIRAADAAMYQAKQRCRGTWSVASDWLDTSASV